MSMKDKALQVKQDFDDVYEAGKENIISNSKYIEKQASGKVIRLDDVSEVAHKVVVKADEPTEVKVYGKNLFNNDTSLLKEVNFNGSSKPDSCIGYEIELPKGRYTFTIAKLDASFDGYIYGMLNNKNGEYVGGFHLTEKKNLFSPLLVTLDEGDKLYVYNAVGKDMSATTALFKKVNIQLSAYSQGGDFEEYHCQTITATSEGTETPSNCPTMTFLADSDVTVDYFGSYGMQTEYDRFWDAFQQNGTRANYAYAFYGAGWNEAIFRPKYDIVATSLAETFYGSPIKDLTSILEKQGVALDTSNCTSLSFVFAHTKITNIPKINMSACTNSSSTFGTSTSLVRIEGIVSSEKTVFDKSTFQNCTAFEHCIFEGTIASDINLQWSKLLDLESLLSLINCLKSFNNSTEEWTKTITLSTESWDLLRAQGNIFSWGGLECDITYYLGEGIRWNMA